LREKLRIFANLSKNEKFDAMPYVLQIAVKIIPLSEMFGQ
jgi:hypothetical protein